MRIRPRLLPPEKTKKMKIGRLRRIGKRRRNRRMLIREGVMLCDL
jgi:hypothetical protein